MKKGHSSWLDFLPNFFRRPVRVASQSDGKDALEQFLLTAFVWIFWILLGVFAFTMVFFEALFPFGRVGTVLSDLLGVRDSQQSSAKFEILKFLAFGIGGTLVALQAFSSYKRSKAMENTAEAQVEANRNTVLGQMRERLKSAVDHLGHASISVRLGGAYELLHLARDNPAFRQTVLDILCVYIRSTTISTNYRAENSFRPSAEIQNLLNLLFRKNYQVFRGLYIDLEGSWLNGADLGEADLSHAILNDAFLRGARFWRAQLQGAVLERAQVQGAYFYSARLQGANLRQAGFQGAYLELAGLQGALIWRAGFQGATFNYTGFQGARSNFASVRELDFQNLDFVDRMGAGVGRESNLSEAVFRGGLEQTEVENFVTGLSAIEAPVLRDKLKSHVNSPATHEFPEASGVMLGTYSQEEAKRWISESGCGI